MMKRKVLSLLLAILALLCALTGCDTVSQIAGNVADAAREELEAQIQAILEEYKLEVVELKTTVGKLNNEGGSVQFFCAVLVRSEKDALLQDCANTLGKVFEDAGVVIQTGSQVESEYLVNKELSYKFDSFDDGSQYYTIYVYTSVLPEVTGGNSSSGN